MLYSMTGYGKAKGEFSGRSYTIDISTLNGRTTDIRMKLPNHFKSKEIELRTHVLEKALRGKIDFTVQMSSMDGDSDYGVNLDLIETYYKQLAELSRKYQMPPQDFLQTIIRIPNVITSRDEDISDEEWAFVLDLVNQSLVELDEFRLQEGESLKSDLSTRTNNIIRLQEEIVPFEAKRKEDLLVRLHKLIEENLTAEATDKNRLEQEVIYYLEKLDIHEEKVRLKQHCQYFNQELQSSDFEVGKKLNFISQEMGREINTLGSKAQYYDIQQKVVQMKVELDQIKEQLANVL